MSEDPVTCNAIPKIVFHIFDAFWLIVLLITQETIINYYIIMRYKEYVFPYFFFALDFLCLCGFVGALFVAYTHLRKYLMNDCTDGFGLRKRRSKPIYRYLGDSPLIFLSWLFYGIIFIIKIVLIFNEHVYIRSLSVEDHFGPQLLKVAMASSGFIFLLLLEGHNWKRRGTPRYSYITSVCAKTGIEIFDSVSMLSILMEGPSELSDSIKDMILLLAAINFILPAIKLYQLSFQDMSKNDYSFPITVIYMVLHLILIDVPFLTIRLYLWLVYRENASMFLMKNALSIILSLRGMYPDLIEFKNDYLVPEKRNIRLNSLRAAQESHMKFEEISLNSKDIKAEDV